MTGKDAAKRLGAADFPEFSFYPDVVIPVELLAIEKLTGIPIGDAKHPRPRRWG